MRQSHANKQLFTDERMHNR